MKKRKVLIILFTTMVLYLIIQLFYHIYTEYNKNFYELEKNELFSTEEYDLFLEEKRNRSKFYAVEGGNIYYDPYTGTITDCDNKVISAVIPDSIYGVKIIKIENGAFEFCENLTEILLPDSISAIGCGAFKGCENLTNILIPTSVKSIESETFYGCENLTTAVLPDTITNIGDWSFARCENLTGMVIPKETISIGSYAFYECNALTGILIPEKTNSIDCSAFVDCDILKGIYVDKKNTEFTSVDGVLFSKDKLKILAYPKGCINMFYEIPDGVIAIGDYAFNENNYLISILIPESVTVIGNFSFQGCCELIYLDIPRNVKDVGDFAFSYCGSIRNINIPEKVINIGRNAFFRCESLESINVDEKNTMYASIDGVLLNKDKFQILDYPDGSKNEIYIIPDGVWTIGNDAFDSCKNLISVIFPEGFANIGESAFDSCENLTNIIIPDSARNIGNFAFVRCKNLKNVTILNNMIIMDSDIFYDCGKNLTIHCYKDSSAETYAKNYNISYKFISERG